MSQALELDAPTERVALNLLRFLEWSQHGFSLIFLFASPRADVAMANWLDERLQLSAAKLQRVNAGQLGRSGGDVLVDAVIGQIDQWNAQDGAVWLQINEQAWSPVETAVRAGLLGRLNERRYLLERDLKRPLVLVFPPDARPDVRALAPDLWHVRALSEELVEPSQLPIDRAGDSFGPAVRAQPLEPQPRDEGDSTAPQQPYDDWLRAVQRAASPLQVSLPLGWMAADALRRDGRLAEAIKVAQQALDLARARLADSEEASDPSRTDGAQRDRSISLDNLGQVAQDQGDWQAAEAAYRESLQIRRALLKRLGDTPEAQRDLSVSLDNLGRVSRAQGDWQAAEAAYRESLAIRRALLKRLGDTPEAQRDLSVSLNNLGQVAQAQGDWLAAEAAYRESLSISRALLERLGDTPEAQRDLSVSLNYLGRVAQAQGDWQAAEAAYRESLDISRALLKRQGDTPEAQRDLSVSLDNLGRVAQAQGDWQAAEAAYRESLAIRRTLLKRLGDTPEAQRDLSISLNNLGQVAETQGDWVVAGAAYRESLDISRALLKRLGDTPEQMDDLFDGLVRVATFPGTQDRQAVLVEAQSLLDQLIKRFPERGSELAEKAKSLAELLEAPSNSAPRPDPQASNE